MLYCPYNGQVAVITRATERLFVSIFHSFKPGIANAFSTFKWRKMFPFMKKTHTFLKFDYFINRAYFTDYFINFDSTRVESLSVFYIESSFTKIQKRASIRLNLPQFPKKCVFFIFYLINYDFYGFKL